MRFPVKENHSTKCLRRDLNPSRSRERAASLTGLDYRGIKTCKIRLGWDLNPDILAEKGLAIPRNTRLCDRGTSTIHVKSEEMILLKNIPFLYTFETPNRNENSKNNIINNTDDSAAMDIIQVHRY